jgi:hypothetical protein
MKEFLILIGAVVMFIICCVLYGLIGWLVYSYGVKKINKLVLWGKTINLEEMIGIYGIIGFWPIIVIAGILISAIGILGHLFYTVKRKL